MASKAEMALILSLVDEVSQTARGIKKDLTDVGKSSQGVKGHIADLGKGLASLGKGAILGGLGLATTALAGAGAMLAKTIGPASDLSETMSKVGVVFGDEADAVIAFGESASTSLGMTKQAALAAAGTYGNLFRSMGMEADVTADMSTGLIGLASDLASFNNMEPTEVLDKLRAGLTGETEPLKSLGVNINAAMLEAKALEMGLLGVDGEMTAAAKAQASYALVMEQTALAQGDFARTSGGLANQQRIFKATLDDLQATVGMAVLPVMESLMGVFIKLAQSEQVQAFIGSLVETLTDLGAKVSEIVDLLVAGDITGALTAAFGEDIATKIMNVVQSITGFIEKIGGLEAIVKPVVVVIGVAMVAAFVSWAIAAGTAAVATITALAPVIAIIAAVGLAVAAAVYVWENDWGGIRTYLTDLWNNTLKPIFETLVEWLQVNIPKAIQAVSDFWTNTLQPAIETVWKFIQDSVFPLLKGLAELFDVALTLAITALAGLWENVLLPAITTVANWFTEHVVPAVKSVMEWLGEKLGPVVTTVTSWFDTMNTAVGGLTGAFKLVTDKVAEFKDWLGKLKLPDWLTPGSPTPLEIAMWGLGDSLGSVVEGFRQFASSVTESQAKALKNMAKAMKELATGIVRLAEASQMGGPLGGGLSAIDDQLKAFETFALQAMARIETIIAAIGYDRIHKLKLTSRRLKEIIEAVLIDLSAIKVYDLPDMNVWGAQFVSVAVAAANAIMGAEEELGKNGIKNAEALASAIVTIVGIIKPVIDAIVAMAEYEPVESLAEKLANLQLRLGEVVTALVETAQGFDVSGVQAAALFYAAAQTIVEFVQPAVEALVALAAWEDAGSLVSKMNSFQKRTGEVIGALVETADCFEQEGVDKAKLFSEASGSIVDLIAPAIQAFIDLLNWEDTGDLKGKMDAFQLRIGEVIGALVETADCFEIDGVQAAGLFSTAAQEMVGLVGPGIEALIALFGWEDTGDMSTKARAFGDRLVEALTELATVPDRAGDLSMTETQKAFWDGVKEMLGIIGTGVTALTKLGEFAAVGDLPAQIKSFATQIVTVVTELAKMPLAIAGALATAQFERSGKLSDISEIMSDPEAAVAGMGGFFKALDPLFATLKKALDAIKAIFSLKDSLSLDDGTEMTIEDALAFFKTAMSLMMSTLGTVATDLETSGMAKAQRFYNAAVGMADRVRAGMNAIATMAEDGIAGTPDMLTRWQGTVSGMMDMLGGGNLTYQPAMAGGGLSPGQGGSFGATSSSSGGISAETIRQAIIEGIRGSSLEIGLSLEDDPGERAQFSARLGRVERLSAAFVTKWESGNG